MIAAKSTLLIMSESEANGEQTGMTLNEAIAMHYGLLRFTSEDLAEMIEDDEASAASGDQVASSSLRHIDSLRRHFGRRSQPEFISFRSLA